MPKHTTWPDSWPVLLVHLSSFLFAQSHFFFFFFVLNLSIACRRVLRQLARGLRLQPAVFSGCASIAFGQPRPSARQQLILASDAAFTCHGYKGSTHYPAAFYFPNYVLGTHSKLGGLGDALGPGNKSMASHGFEPVTIGTPVERAATRPPYPPDHQWITLFLLQ